MKNNRGVVTFQFLIVLTIILFFIISFFGLALTLVNGSAVQYLTYSSARKLSLGAQNKGTQEAQANRQYQRLRSQLFGSKWVSSGEWFNISKEPSVVGENPRYKDKAGSYRNMFYGVVTSFSSARTNFKIPFLSNSGDGALTASIGSYLGREPTKDECEQFNLQRSQKICELFAGLPCAPNPQLANGGDNAC